MRIVEVVRWIGMVLVFTAYLPIIMNKGDRCSLRYHGVNLIGTCCIYINALVNAAYPSAALNILWHK